MKKLILLALFGASSSQLASMPSAQSSTIRFPSGDMAAAARPESAGNLKSKVQMIFSCPAAARYQRYLDWAASKRRRISDVAKVRVEIYRVSRMVGCWSHLRSTDSRASQVPTRTFHLGLSHYSIEAVKDGNLSITPPF